jgi:hypothetical protein
MGREGYIGRSLEQVPLRERPRLAGYWAAFELYSPQTTPLRKIQALGASVDECVRALQGRGLDPRQFEYVLLK